MKNFQQENVINHHTVVYEQALLRKAMESVALLSQNQQEESDNEFRKKFLANLCKLESFIGKLSPGGLGNYPTDDYFICKMRA